MHLVILDEVAEFLDSLSPEDSAKVLASLKFLEMNRTEVLFVKPLKGKIMELVVKRYRVVYFRIETTIYTVAAFKKQSQKAPLRVIERAERMYRECGG